MARNIVIEELPSVNVKDVEEQVTRFGNTFTKTLSFHDGVKWSVDRFQPGSHTFAHQHGFRQLRYVLEGEFEVNGKVYGPGTLIEFPAFKDYEVRSKSGGLWIVWQGTDPKTGLSPTSATGKEYGEKTRTE